MVIGSNQRLLSFSDNQGPVVRSLVCANRWLRGIKTYRFPWSLTLVRANHASSSSGQINIEIDAKLTTKAKEAKSLGVIIDEHQS